MKQLIVLEGIDNSGKTTFSKYLKVFLEKLYNKEVVLTKQPGGNYLASNLIEQLCKRKDLELDPVSNLLAFLIDRIEMMKKIVLPNLNAGKIVISDRWWYSTFAYQLIGKNLIKYLPKEMATWVKNFGEFGIKPDLILYFPYKIKKIVKDSNDIYDDSNIDDKFQERVINAYESLSKNFKFYRMPNLTYYPENTYNKLIARILHEVRF